MLTAIILGIIQGISEFLPISSSGHLVLAQKYMELIAGKEIGNTEDITLEIILHLGTLIAIVVIYRTDILSLFTSAFNSNKKIRNTALHYMGAIILASVPIAIVGLKFKDAIEGIFEDPLYASSFLFVTGTILYASKFGKVKGDGKITYKSALFIGIAQAFAILPGISRSGSTISTALLCGVDRKEAGRFSFLIFLPAVSGVTLDKFLELHEKGTLSSIFTMDMGAGFLASVIMGFITLTLLLKFIDKGNFYLFSFYCIAVGAISTIVFALA